MRSFDRTKKLFFEQIEYNLVKKNSPKKLKNSVNTKFNKKSLKKYSSSHTIKKYNKKII